MAQGLERIAVNVQVVGSNPTREGFVGSWGEGSDDQDRVGSIVAWMSSSLGCP